MDKLRALFVEGAETAVKQNKEMLEKANQIMNVIIMPLIFQKQKGYKWKWTKKFPPVKKTKIRLDFVPPPLARTDEVKEATT